MSKRGSSPNLFLKCTMKLLVEKNWTSWLVYVNRDEEVWLQSRSLVVYMGTPVSYSLLSCRLLTLVSKSSIFDRSSHSSILFHFGFGRPLPLQLLFVYSVRSLRPLRVLSTWYIVRYIVPFVPRSTLTVDLEMYLVNPGIHVRVGFVDLLVGRGLMFSDPQLRHPLKISFSKVRLFEVRTTYNPLRYVITPFFHLTSDTYYSRIERNDPRFRGHRFTHRNGVEKGWSSNLLRRHLFGHL